MVSSHTWLLRSLQVVFILGTHCLLFEAVGENVSVSPGDLDAVTGRWNANLTCVSRIASAVPFFNYEINGGPEISVPTNYVRTINNWTIELRHFPQIDAQLIDVSLRYVTCLISKSLENDGDRYAVEVTIRKPHENPRITDIEVDNWKRLRFAWETKEDWLMHPMAYKAWYWNSSNDARPLECNHTKNNVCNVLNPFQIALPGDVLMVKVNGSVKTRFSRGILETVTSEEVRVNLTEYITPRKVDEISVVQNKSTKILVFKPPKTNRNISYDFTVNCTKPAFNQSETITRLTPDSDEATESDRYSKTNLVVAEPLVGLPPHSSCTVYVRAISVTGGKWSEWAFHHFQTLQDVPLALPRSCKGCFQVKNAGMDSLSQVIVYFTPLSEEEARGIVELYRIKTIENGFTKNVTELVPDPPCLTSFLLSDLSNESEYEINIEAKTKSGYNETLNLSSMAILVPQSNHRPSSLSYKFTFIVLNATSVRATLEMKKRRNRDRMFLFWCKGTVESDRPCEDVLKWKTFPIASTGNAIRPNADYVIKLEEDEFSGDFVFGSGIERSGKSSGITWSSCTYDIRLPPPKPRIESYSSTSSGISISLLEPTCQDLGPDVARGFVIGYQAFLCPNESVGSTDDRPCLEEMRSVNFSGSPKVLNLNDLSSNQTYLIMLLSSSESRTSEPVSIIVTTKTVRAFDLWAVIVPVVILVVLVAIALIPLAPFKGKRLWQYVKDVRTVLPIVIPSAVRFTNHDSEEINAEDEGYKSNESGGTEGLTTVIASQPVSVDSSGSESPAENGSSFLFSDDVPQSRDFSVAGAAIVALNDPITDVPVAFNGPGIVDLPTASDDPVTVDVSGLGTDHIPCSLSGPGAVDSAIAFNCPATSAVSVAFNVSGIVGVSASADAPSAAGVSVVSEAVPIVVDVPVNVDVAFSVAPFADLSPLGPTKLNSRVDDCIDRILPSLFTCLATASRDLSNHGVVGSRTEVEPSQHQPPQSPEPVSETLQRVSSPISESLDPEQNDSGGYTDQSTHDNIPCQKPSNLDEGYVCGSQRVCDVFLPVPCEPAQPVTFDSGSEFNRNDSEPEDAVTSLQTDFYYSSAALDADVPGETGCHGLKISPSRSADSVRDDTRNDSDYPPMRIIEVDFRDDYETLEEEPLANDIRISTDVILISDDVDFKIKHNVAVTTDDLNADVIASSPDVTTTSGDSLPVKTVSCSSTGGILQPVCGYYRDGGCDPDDSVDDDCIYSTVVEINPSGRAVDLGDSVLPAPGGDIDDGYYSGGRVLDSLSSSPRSPISDGLEDGRWPMRVETQDQRNPVWSADTISLNQSTSTTFPWSLNHQSPDAEVFNERVLPSILPPCV